MFSLLQVESGQLEKIKIFKNYMDKKSMGDCTFLIDSNSKIRKKLKIADRLCEKICKNRETWALYDLTYARYIKNFSVGPESNVLVSDVVKFFEKIGNLVGPGSTNKKILDLKNFCEALNSSEKYWFFALLRSKLRIGFSNNNFVLAIHNLGYKTLTQCKRIYGIASDLTDFWRRINLEISDKIEYFKPVRPMLVKTCTRQRFKTLLETKKYLMQPKFDGFRLQVHHHNGRFKYYTRRLEQISKSLYPLTPIFFKNLKNLPNFIIDGQLVSDDHAFQDISRVIMRKVPDIKIMAALNLKLYVFDIIKLGKIEYTKSRFDVRMAILRRKLAAHLKIEPVNSNLVFNLDQVVDYANSGHMIAHQGVVLKKADSPYRMGYRHTDWLKYKKDNHTADLIVVGAKMGIGKFRCQYGSYLMGLKIRNRLKTIGFVGSGFSDLLRAQYHKKFSKIQISEPLDRDLRLKHNQAGMIWFMPEHIFEIEFQELQKTSDYTSGYSMRFPIHKRIRPDKSPEDATKIEELKAIYVNP